MRNMFKCTKVGVSVGVWLLGAAGGHATMNFTGQFAPSQWTLQPDQGTVAFVNSDTELDIIGPTGNFFPSYDAASVAGPATIMDAKWLINFDWAFNAGDAEGATVSLSWGGEPDGNPVVLASGGPGSSDTGMVSLVLDQGDTLTILLDSDLTGAGKQPASFDITQFTYSVPDATPWIEASLFLPFLMRRYLPASRGQK